VPDEWTQLFQQAGAGLRAAIGAELRLVGSDERLAWRKGGEDLIVRLSALLPDQPVHVPEMPVPT